MKTIRKLNLNEMDRIEGGGPLGWIVRGLVWAGKKLFTRKAAAALAVEGLSEMEHH